ncbi:MAG: glycosyltransferase, partial [Loktanella sp.]|nr:glycosyltransferase [Loktanella sp.]
MVDNRADYIRDTIDSLLVQDYPHFDITVVNDGSPDPRVREILDSYADPRLRVIHQDNTGFIRTAVSIPEGLALPTLANGVLQFGFVASQIADPRKGFSALAPFLSAVAARSGKTVQLHAYGWAREGSLANIP